MDIHDVIFWLEIVYLGRFIQHFGMTEEGLVVISDEVKLLDIS